MRSLSKCSLLNIVHFRCITYPTHQTPLPPTHILLFTLSLSLCLAGRQHTQSHSQSSRVLTLALRERAREFRTSQPRNRSLAAAAGTACIRSPYCCIAAVLLYPYGTPRTFFVQLLPSSESSVCMCGYPPGSSVSFSFFSKRGRVSVYRRSSLSVDGGGGFHHVLCSTAASRTADSTRVTVSFWVVLPCACSACTTETVNRTVCFFVVLSPGSKILSSVLGVLLRCCFLERFLPSADSLFSRKLC